MTGSDGRLEDVVDLVVAIPAHDEEETIGACLDAVATAVSEGQRAGVVGRARIAVAAHRCVDQTRQRAQDHLAGLSGIESLVRDEPEDLLVGAVRTRLIEDAITRSPALSADCWILSTDADTIVPPDWVTGLLAAARSSGAELVLGLADLDEWRVGPEARRRYQQLLDAGIDGGQHRHVYAANLAVAWQTFAAVGGFPAVPHGEEHALVRAVRAHGRRVVSPLGPRVRTSARMPGRAAGGLGGLLAELAGGRDDPSADCSPTAALPAQRVSGQQ